MLHIKNSKSGRAKPYKPSKGGPGRVFRNAIISVLILLLLFVGGGLLYTWYMGKKNPVDADSVIGPLVVPKPPKSPTQTAPDSVVGVSVRMITSPIQPGSVATLSVHTNTKTRCTIRVEYNKMLSKDPALVPKISDEFGMVSWTWTVEPSTPYGKWPAAVVCANSKHSGKVTGNLVVEKAGTPPSTPPPIQ